MLGKWRGTSGPHFKNQAAWAAHNIPVDTFSALMEVFVSLSWKKRLVSLSLCSFPPWSMSVPNHSYKTTKPTACLRPGSGRSIVRTEQSRREQDRTEQNRIQLEGTYSDHLVQLPDHFRAFQKLKHVINSIVQMPLENWEAWAISHHSRMPLFKCLPPSR